MAPHSAIILSAGVGSRMKENTPKQYLLIGGKPMIMHSIERLDNLSAVNEIIIVCDIAYRDELKKMLEEYAISTTIKFVQGGAVRQESVYNGLIEVSNDYVIIHEAARPFVKQSEFQSLINETEENVTLAYDIPFTVLKGKEYIEGNLNRSELINIQLPQRFSTAQLREAHEKALAKGEIYTEDASLMFANATSKIKVKKGTSYNIKITDPLDLIIGEIVYKNIITNRN